MKATSKLRYAMFALVLPVMLLNACGAGDSRRESVAAQPVSPDYGPPEIIGKIESKAIDESSGLAVSLCQPDVLWTHNDQAEPFVFAMSPAGKHLGVWRLPNAENVDWEDLAIRKDASGKCFLYAADTGNNELDRSEADIYRIAEPAVTPESAALTPKSAAVTEPAERLRFRYSDAEQNVESVFVHPAIGDIYLVTKQNKGPASVYQLIPAFGTAVQRAEKIGEVSVESERSGRFTGGAISPDGTRVMLCDERRGYELVLPAGADFAEIWKQQPKAVDIGKRPQGESVAYSPDGRSVYASSERASAPIIRITRR